MKTNEWKAVEKPVGLLTKVFTNAYTMATSKEEKLAREIADVLNDTESLTVHIGFVEKYSEAFLRKTLQKVLSIPENQIRKTRGALFTYLVKQHGWRNTDRD